MNNKYYVKKFSIVSVSMLVLLCSGCAEWKKKWESENGIMYENQISIEEEQIHHIGEEIARVCPTMENEENVSMNYMIEKVTMVSDFEEIGIREEQVMASIEYIKNGDFMTITSEDMKKNPMLILDIKITNVNEEDPNISTFTLVKRKGDEIEQFTSPCYYSLGKDIKEEEYYHFSLEKGDTTDVRVGYYIDKEEERLEDVMLTDNYGGDDEITNYVDLGL